MGRNWGTFPKFNKILTNHLDCSRMRSGFGKKMHSAAKNHSKPTIEMASQNAIRFAIVMMKTP